MFNRDALKKGEFSWDSALSLARASQLSYQRSAEAIRHVATETWGFDGCIVYDAESTQGFVAWDDGCVVLAFRGTTSIGDWLANLDLLPVTRPYGRVHAGFFRGFEVARGQLESALQDAASEGKKIWLTGHSLGGAVATIATAELGESVGISGLYTFGQPKTVGGQAAQFFRDTFNGRVHRFVNDDDIVSAIPPGYQHIGRLIWFDPHGQLREFDPASESGEPEGEAVLLPHDMTEDEFDRLQKQFQKIKAAIENQSAVEGDPEALLDASVEGIIPGVRDHRIANYIKQIQRHVRSGVAVDGLIEQQVIARRAMASGLESASGPSTRSPLRSGKSVPVLLRVRDPRWKAPEGLKIQSRLGTVISASLSVEQIESLRSDEEVLSIDASREGGSIELADSMPFIRASDVSRPPLEEQGDAALVAIIDAGIDVLHEAFQDDAGQGRILYVWDQRTQSAGASPNEVNNAFSQTYGTLYARSEIQQMIAGTQPTPLNLRDLFLHGTHVASIAAGRAVGSFAGGVAPQAGLIVVIPDMVTGPGDPPSIGYSSSHVDALAFVRSAAAEMNLPVAVNVSLGMNAGAHDGSSTLEAAFDAFTGLGRDLGIVLVKSAGNERSHRGHARADVALGAISEITWDSISATRSDDYFEFWFHKFDDIEFALEDPSGNTSAAVSSDQPKVDELLGGNVCQMRLARNHRDNGDNLLSISILSDTQPIQSGKWKLKMQGLTVQGDGVVHGWVERDRARAVSFDSGDNDEMTLSIPGTAEHVITVAACGSALPLQLTSSSSWGLTRDGRTKPDLCAPGTGIMAARANQPGNQGVMENTGTSMAAPHVTGSIALVLSSLHKDPAKTQVNANQIRTALISSAKNFTGLHNKGVGYGALDTLDFFQQF